MSTLKRWWAGFQASRVGRAWKRYGNARGNLLAGGMTYFAFLSVFPALALGLTVFGIVLKGRPELLADVQDSLRRALPGFVQDENGNGLIPVSLPSSTTLSVAGVIATVGLLLTGLGWLSASRDGIRTVFGAAGAPGNLVTAKLRDLVVMVGFGLGFVLSAAITVVANAVTSRFAEAVGMKNQSWLVTGVGLAVGILVDGLLIALMLRVLSGVAVPWRGVRNGAVLGGVGLTLLKLLGTRLLAGTLSNPVYGSIALVAGLMVWLNLIARVTLIAAAYAANDLEATPEILGVSEGVQQKAIEGPQEPPTAVEPGAVRAPVAVGAASAGTGRPAVGVTGAAVGRPADLAAARAAQGLPTFDQRTADRVSLVSGAALGVTVAALVGTGARTIRRLVHPNR